MKEDMKPSRRRFLSMAGLAAAGAQFGTVGLAKPRSDLSFLDHATAWINFEPPVERQLTGKVVLVEFWTYSCINWRRQLPYVRAWYERYQNQGLAVVGVHSPEFPFEKDPENVRWAVKNMRISYAVGLDNGFAIWRAFKNDAWPALYFIDRQGRIRDQVFGEGRYAQSESTIQKLLREAGATGVGSGYVSVDPHGAEAAADWKELRSGENYLGYARTQNFASPGGMASDKTHTYRYPKGLKLNEWALSGEWNIGSGSILSNRSGGSVSYRFHARDVHFVIGPAARGKTVRFRVTLDGEPPAASHGEDVDDQGRGVVIEPRMYQLIRQNSPIADRQVTIEFLDPGVEAFSFTFG